MAKPSLAELEEYAASYKKDTDFAAYARLLQSQWRKRKDFQQDPTKLGNYLEVESAREKGSNFLTDNIVTVVKQEIANAQLNGGMISQPRIWVNLLSSQPLCFNLFGELSLDLPLATLFFQRLFPWKIDLVTGIRFEYSPKRGDPKFTGDKSAFDVFVEYVHEQKPGFIGIEVKYAENLKESAKKSEATFHKHQSRYIELTNQDIFKQGSLEELKRAPLAQIWRDHLLVLATRRADYEGFFVFLFPEQNGECFRAVEAYRQLLNNSNEDSNLFCPRYLEDFIKALRQVSQAGWTRDLEERYLGTSE